MSSIFKHEFVSTMDMSFIFYFKIYFYVKCIYYLLKYLFLKNGIIFCLENTSWDFSSIHFSSPIDNCSMYTSLFSLYISLVCMKICTLLSGMRETSNHIWSEYKSGCHWTVLNHITICWCVDATDGEKY